MIDECTISSWDEATMIIRVTSGADTIPILVPSDLLIDRDALLSFIREQVSKAKAALPDPSHLVGVEL